MSTVEEPPVERLKIVERKPVERIDFDNWPVPDWPTLSEDDSKELGWVVADDSGRRLKFPIERGGFALKSDDLLLFAMLQDRVYCPELLWEDPGNRAYGGCYRVRDYQYQINRADEMLLIRGSDAHNIAFACARAVGKTESIKGKAVTHPFRRQKMNLLVTAPQLIHLLPLTDEIEDTLESTRLTRSFLDKRNQGTGFGHRPFEARFVDGTKIVGRIPQRDGKGVKGQHQPDTLVDEGQDYPEPGWVELDPTVMREIEDWSFHFYGVHSGDRGSMFAKHVESGNFHVVQVTAIMRPDWSAAQKRHYATVYGGTASPDYRRNILGEAGGQASAYFVLARLFACMDQNRESEYNELEYVHQELHAEVLDSEFEGAATWEDQFPIVAQMLDLPPNLKAIWIGMDVGLTDSPSVISIWSEETVKGVKRLKLVRRIHLNRWRTRHQRMALYAIAYHFGSALKGVGIDSTGLGLPFFQEMDDDEKAPKHLMDVTRGYFFNSKQPVTVDKTHVEDDGKGHLTDPYGNRVERKEDPLTGEVKYIVYMPMIEASTRYLREWVDLTFLLLPFDPEIARDMQAETTQRVARIAGRQKKPEALHILDSFRAMAMVRNAERIERELAEPEQEEVLDIAVAA